MKRRSFFALLAAPFIARFWPKITIFKSRSLGPTVPFEFRIAPGSLDEITRLQRELLEMQLRRYFFVSSGNPQPINWSEAQDPTKWQ